MSGLGYWLSLELSFFIDLYSPFACFASSSRFGLAKIFRNFSGMVLENKGFHISESDLPLAGDVLLLSLLLSSSYEMRRVL